MINWLINLKNLMFSIATVRKDAHLTTYMRYVLEYAIKEDLFFCKPIDGRAVSLKVFSVIKLF